MIARCWTADRRDRASVTGRPRFALAPAPTCRAARGSAAASTCCRACSRWPTCSAATPASSTRCAASSTTAAPFIGIAIVLDMLDGRIARMTGTTSEFGVAVRLAGRRRSRSAWRRRFWRSRGGCTPLGRLGLGGRVPVRRRGGGAPGALQHPGGLSRQALLRRACRARRPRRAGGDGLRLPDGISDVPAGAAGARDGDRAGAADGQHHPVPQLQDARPATSAATRCCSCWPRSSRRSRASPTRCCSCGLRLPGVGLHRAGAAAVPRYEARRIDGRAFAACARTAAGAEPSRKTNRGAQASQPPATPAATGSDIVTVVPAPRCDVTAIVPPFTSTLRFAIGRPRPVPWPWSRSTARRSGRAPSASMPTPVSEIAQVQQPSRDRARP